MQAGQGRAELNLCALPLSLRALMSTSGCTQQVARLGNFARSEPSEEIKAAAEGNKARPSLFTRLS